MKKLILSIATIALAFSAEARLQYFQICYPSIKAACWNYSNAPNCTNCVWGVFREDGSMVNGGTNVAFARAGINVPEGAEPWEIKMDKINPGDLQVFPENTLPGNLFEDGLTRVFPQQNAVWSAESNAFLLYCYAQ